MTQKNPEISDHIKMGSHHWCRAHDRGTIVAVFPRGRYEILFDTIGAGYNNGSTLIADFKDFEVTE
jgi:hypothetical protein